MKFVTGVLLKSDPALRTFLLRLKRSNPELFGGRDVAEIELGQDYLFISHAHADIALKLQPYIDDWLQVRRFPSLPSFPPCWRPWAELVRFCLWVRRVSSYCSLAHVCCESSPLLLPQRTTYGDGTSAANRMDDDFADSDVDG